MSSFDEMDAFEGASLSARAMAARPVPYLDGLNPAQREAVEALDGPVLVLAGAGTGKTRTLIYRLAYLVETGTRPQQIVLLTFTRRAASDMKARASSLLDGRCEKVRGGTFHAFCLETLRQHAEASLKSAEEFNRLSRKGIEASPNGVMITSATAEAPIVHVNRAFERITGFSRDEVIGRNPRFLYRNDSEQRGLSSIRNAISNQREGEAVLRYYRKDGTLFWNELTVAPVFDDEGIATHFVGIINDITDRKQAERALQVSEERWRRLVRYHPEPILISVDAEIRYINAAGARAFGAEQPEDIIGRSVLDFAVPDVHDTLESRIEAIKQGAHTDPFEHRLIRLTGEERIAVEGAELTLVFDGGSEDFRRLARDWVRSAAAAVADYDLVVLGETEPSLRDRILGAVLTPILDEIETTKRRVNALEFKLLPELKENQEYIEQKLEEQEREEIFRMKKIKAKKEEEEKEPFGFANRSFVSGLPT